jgi:subtilisin-like proprotein convertase family protein
LALISIDSILRRDALRFCGLFTACLLWLPLTANAQSGTLLISEFRVRGPSGAQDEFIEIYNNATADHTVASISGTGYGIAASDGTTRCTIPNGTIIPGRGHYLCVNSVAYSLAGYSAGNASYTTDIPDNAGIALFNNNTGGGSYSLANRFDAVGSTAEANTVYKEGTGYPALTPFSIDYSFTRRVTGGCTGSAGGDCGSAELIRTTLGPTSAHLRDTGVNATDFIFVDTNGTSAGAGQRLGAPGPENLASPIYRLGAALAITKLDPCEHLDEVPNQVRDFTSDPANNSTFGTLDVRRTFTNATGVPLTRLRFRVVDITTFPSISGVADLRPRTSSDLAVTVDRPPCGTGTSGVTVRGTTLEQPPSQPNGSGFNGSLSVGAVTLGTPLAAGASVDVRFLLGIQQTGVARFCVAAETLPVASSQILCVIGATDVATTFTNGAAILIPGTGTSGPAAAYPSNISVSGVTAPVTKVTVTIKNLTHTFPDDVDVLLVGPTGVKLILMSDAGGSTDWTGQNFTFDSTASAPLQDGAASPTGTYRPANYGSGDTFAAPAPVGPYLEPEPTGSGSLAAFNGLNPNGTWSLYIVDDVGGDVGSFAGGWDLTITTAVQGVVPWDFNGDRTSDLAVFQSSTGLWLVQNQPTEIWGVPGDIPVAGDYDGDGRTDRAVYRPSNGTWFVHNQGQVVWGAAGDIPVPGDYNGSGTTERAVYRPLNGTWFVQNRAPVQWGAAGDVPVPGDYNGDGTTDIAVYRPLNGTWFVQNQAAVQWGAPGDIPVPGDYNGDGVTDIALYRPSSGQWIVRGLFTVGWGASGDVPVPGDYNGDGTTDIAVYRPLNGTWFVQNLAPVQLGGPGDLPVPRPETPGDINWDGTTDVGGYLGDFDGNGTTDIAVYRPTSGTWSVQNQGQVVWGLPGDIPVPGDYNGDGLTDRAVFRVTDGTWYVQNGVTVQWGQPGDIPVPADYNGDGLTDIAVYRPSTGTWFVQNQFTLQWGQPADIPVPGDYNGDGLADIAVYRPSNGTWFVRGLFTVVWGAPGDIPVSGDFNGDGLTDVAIYRPSNGTWYAQGQAPVQWGGPGDLPVPGDFNGNGVTDRAVFRPSSVTWFVQSQFTLQWGLLGDIPASRAYVPR